MFLSYVLFKEHNNFPGTWGVFFFKNNSLYLVPSKKLKAFYKIVKVSKIVDILRKPFEHNILVKKWAFKSYWLALCSAPNILSSIPYVKHKQ